MTGHLSLADVQAKEFGSPVLESAEFDQLALIGFPREMRNDLRTLGSYSILIYVYVYVYGVNGKGERFWWTI